MKSFADFTLRALKICLKHTSHATAIYHFIKTRVFLNLRTLQISPKQNKEMEKKTHKK